MFCLLWIFLLYGCHTTQLSVKKTEMIQHITQEVYITNTHNFKNSYIYEAAIKDSIVIIIQPKVVSRRALCTTQSYYQVLLEEVHQFKIPYGISIERLGQAPYSIVYQKKIVFENGWLGVNTNLPIYYLLEAAHQNNPDDH